MKTKAERRMFYVSSEWRQFRLKILDRDNHECVWCAMEGKVTTRNDATLEVDHIKEIRDHPELALDEDNCRTLCRNCHNKRHDRYMEGWRFKKKETKWGADEKW